MKRNILFFLFFLLIELANSQSIFDASRSGNIKRIKEIYVLNPDSINVSNEQGYSPLILATYNHQVEATKLLIKLGVKLESEFDQGNALHGACYKNYLDIATILVDAGIDINATDNGGTMPIHYATIRQNIPLCRLLYDNGANLNSKDKNGLTALEYAKQLGLIDLLDYYNEK